MYFIEKKFAKFPIKEKLNVYGEGGIIFRKYYYEYIINGSLIRERVEVFNSDEDFINGFKGYRPEVTLMLNTGKSRHVLLRKDF